MTQPRAQAVLTPEDQAFFEQQGYLLVEDALPSDALAELNEATDALYARDADAGRLEKGGKLNMRNCIVEHPDFLQLLDWPTTVPLAWAAPRLEYPDADLALNRPAFGRRAG